MAISRLRMVRGEVETTFATENGSHSWLGVRAIDPQLTMEQQLHPQQYVQQRITQFPGAHLLGRRSGRLSFGMYLCGDGTPLSVAAATTGDTLHSLVKLAMGGASSAQGSAAKAGCTLSTINVNTSANFSAGAAIMAPTGTSQAREISVIKSIANSTLTLEWKMSSAATTAEKVFNSFSYYIDPAATTTWQFQCVGEAGSSIDSFLCLGCVGGFSFTNLLGLDGPPQINFDLQVTRWETDVVAITATTTYDCGADPLNTATQMQCFYQDENTTTRTFLPVSNVEINPGIVWTPLYARGQGDTEHVERIRMTRVEPTVTFTTDAAAAYWTELNSQTVKRFALLFGATEGYSWVIDIPRAYVQTVPVRAEHAEQTAVTVTLRAKEDDAGAATSAMLRSPLRIHRL